MRLDGLTLGYDRHPAVHHLDGTIHRGDLLALVGPNGAGKSTLLSLAAGDQRPTAGSVDLHGRPIHQWKIAELARERSVLPQDHAVRFAFTVREVVAMGRLPHPPKPAQDAAIVEAALATADVVPLQQRDVQSLSGGEAARTGFARVLAQQTPLILLDEPTAALDLQHQERVLRSARALTREGACVIAVLHDLNLAAAYADRIV
ncbi:MAG: ATP-binding cassette domain-containing protein, partial [Variovorax sp.]